MKQFIYLVCATIVMLAGCNIAEAQVVKEGKTFITSSTNKSSDNNIKTDYIWKDSKGVEYPIYLHQYTKGENAGQWTCYVVKVSQNTGKEYKYYLPNGKEIAIEIRKEMGIK